MGKVVGKFLGSGSDGSAKALAAQQQKALEAQQAQAALANQNVAAEAATVDAGGTAANIADSTATTKRRRSNASLSTSLGLNS